MRLVALRRELDPVSAGALVNLFQVSLPTWQWRFFDVTRMTPPTSRRLIVLAASRPRRRRPSAARPGASFSLPASRRRPYHLAHARGQNRRVISTHTNSMRVGEAPRHEIPGAEKTSRSRFLVLCSLVAKQPTTTAFFVERTEYGWSVRVGSDRVGLFATQRHALAEVQRRRGDLKTKGHSTTLVVSGSEPETPLGTRSLRPFHR